jgi:hypothetical protein
MAFSSRLPRDTRLKPAAMATLSHPQKSGTRFPPSASDSMTDLSTMMLPVQAAPLCWICNRNEANSGEHKTKRSDLLAVLGKPTQETPFYFHDLEKPNRPVKSLDAKILKSPVRICADCNNARTQPHDRAWERMSDRLRTCRGVRTLSRTRSRPVRSRMFRGLFSNGP